MRISAKYSINDAMNFTCRSSIISGSFLVVLAASVLGCNVRFEPEDISGDVLVRIPISETVSVSATSENTTSQTIANYSLQTVQLKGLTSLKEVKGQYAQFYYSPGVQNNTLTGFSPFAFFIKTLKDIFIPQDVTSLQMSSLYFHLQKLTELSLQLNIIKATEVKPFKIGLETKVSNDSTLQVNNAFYDGRTDAMLFVPFADSQIPISVNAGIIAHEYFHSLFYKKVFAVAKKNKTENTDEPTHQKFSSDTVHGAEGWRSQNFKLNHVDHSASLESLFFDDASYTLSPAELYNESYLRGLNEGLADFWAWVYTQDADFMKWSLPAYTSERSLKIQNTAQPKVISSQLLLASVDQAMVLADNPSQHMSFIIYKIGTPYAQYLKQLTEVIASQKKISLKEASLLLAQTVIQYLDFTADKLKLLKDSQVLNIMEPFYFFMQQSPLNSKEACDLSLKYLNASSAQNAVFTCELKNEKFVLLETKP